MDSRAALLRTALTLFSSRGYDSVGVQELAEVTGVTKPTLYHFFGSKNGLLEALFQEYANRLDESVAAACRYEGDLPKTLDKIATAYIDFCTSEPLAYQLELALYFSPRENPVRAVAVKHFARRQTAIENIFEEATREHGNLRGKSRRYAFSFVGTLNSYLVLQLDGEVTISDRLRREIVQQFSHGIYS